MGSAKRTKRKKDVQSAAFGLHKLPGKLLEDVDLDGRLWFECAPQWPEKADGGVRATKEEWKEAAVQALSTMCKNYDKQSFGNGRKDVQRLLSKEKTVADKIAAATLVVQESPLHRLDELHTLFSFVKKKGGRERSPAIMAFKDLLINDLLPDDRRLVKFEDREFDCGAQTISKRHLCYALFEDELKTIMDEFLQVLDECATDSIDHFKLKSVSICFDLLAAKPEREKELLTMLVNKLGDPIRKVASNAAYFLRKLVEEHHPQMKLVLIQEVEQLLFRSNVGLRTRYYSIMFLNQLRFNKGDVALTRRLVLLYMNIVGTCFRREGGKGTGNKEGGGLESQESRLLGALLTGVNRAFPFTDPESFDLSLGTHYDTLFRISHAKSVASATQALAFLLQISKTNTTISDRFYRALYSRIPSLSEAGESRLALLLNVIFKGMMADISTKRVKAFTKRLLQTALKGTPALAGGILLLLSEVLFTKHPGILKASVGEEAEDDEEEFKDVKSDEEEAVPEPNEEKETDTVPTNIKKNDKDENSYDIDAREPLFARAERSALWELDALASHYHPSIRKFAKGLCCAAERVVYPSDPLTDFTLNAFLDKFSYKKPKKKLSDSLHAKRTNRASEALVLKSNNFLGSVRKGTEADDEVFFGKFFNINPGKLDVLEGITVKEIKDKEPEELPDIDDDSEEEEQAFEKAMHEEMRRLGGGDMLPEDDGEDDEDDDEMAAFADAFKDEMDKASDAGDDVEDYEALPMLMDDEGEGEVEEIPGPKKKKNISVFAAAADYEEAIDNAIEEAKNYSGEGEEKKAARRKQRKTKKGKGRKRPGNTRAQVPGRKRVKT